MGGCGLVIWGWTVIGLILEAYGFWLLFCEFIPTALQFFRRVPFMSRILDLPVMKTVGVLFVFLLLSMNSPEKWVMHPLCAYVS